jgi:hypothetical protein
LNADVPRHAGMSGHSCPLLQKIPRKSAPVYIHFAYFIDFLRNRDIRGFARFGGVRGEGAYSESATSIIQR